MLMKSIHSDETDWLNRENIFEVKPLLSHHLTYKKFVNNCELLKATYPIINNKKTKHQGELGSGKLQ